MLGIPSFEIYPFARISESFQYSRENQIKAIDWIHKFHQVQKGVYVK